MGQHLRGRAAGTRSAVRVAARTARYALLQPRETILVVYCAPLLVDEDIIRLAHARERLRRALRRVEVRMML